jgi:hypothetical protein
MSGDVDARRIDGERAAVAVDQNAVAVGHPAEQLADAGLSGPIG